MQDNVVKSFMTLTKQPNENWAYLECWGNLASAKERELTLKYLDSVGFFPPK